MVWTSVLQSPPYYQWMVSSGSTFSSASNNCGPTCSTKEAVFYLDEPNLSIEKTRRLVAPCCVPTTGRQQAEMLTARGVPATAVWIDSLAQLDALLGDGGTRPITVGIEMIRVPAWVRDHPFLGWHAVCVMAKAIKDGVHGYWVNDPNFSPAGGHRPDPDRGKKFYSRSVMQYAFIGNWIRWAVVPNRRKNVFVNQTVEGDPAGMGVRFVNELGKKVTIRPLKPLRSGISIKSPVIKRFADRHTLHLVGRVRVEDLDSASRPYGPAWVTSIASGDGKNRLAYVMHADIVSGSYRA